MTHELRRPLAELAATYGDDLQRQIELEERMVSMGRDQIRKQIARAREKGNETGTGYGKALIAMSVEKIGAAVAEFIAKAETGGAGRRHAAVKYLKRLDNEVAAFIAMRCVVDSLTGKKQVMQRAAVQIGTRIEDEVRFTAFAAAERQLFNRAKKRARHGTSYHRKQATMAGYERRFMEDKWVPWPEQQRLHIGVKMIDFIVATGLVEIGDEVLARRKTNKILVPTATLVDWIERETTRSELLTPSHLPMIVEPLNWTDPYNGGYLTHAGQSRNTMVKTRNQNYLTELADHAGQMPLVYEGLNALQSTRWGINRRVYAALTELWELGHATSGLPSREDIGAVSCPSCGASLPLAALNTRGSVQHACFEVPEILRQWKKDAYKSHMRNVSLRSKRLHIAKTLRVADLFAKEEVIYFPYQLDFRGRIYCIPSFNPQGNDVTKGLLHFSDGKPIADGVAAGWLAIQGANVWGFDKAALEDRIQWVEDNTDMIISVAGDPIADNRWADADKPFQFLAFCFEWAGFMEQGYGFISKLPVALDGSCSGIQHFSAMLRDPVGGRAVNLVPSDKPEDIYQRVCDRVLDKLRKDANELTPTIAKGASEFSIGTRPPAQKESRTEATTIAIGKDELARGWLKLEPNRGTTKRQVMTLPYGSTRFSCREYTETWLKEQLVDKPEPWAEEDRFKATQYMSDLIWESIGEEVIAARQAMGWLQQCARVVAAEELPVYWTTPTGFVVMQQYHNFTARRVDTRVGEVVIKLSLQQELDTIDKRRMQNAISPNFVHSMDATHLMMSVCSAKDNDINSFAMIHDSFGTHAADTNMLAACLRKAFVDLYRDLDVLEDFREQIMLQVSDGSADTIPAVPCKGSLDIEAVLASDFFFA